MKYSTHGQPSNQNRYAHFFASARLFFLLLCVLAITPTASASDHPALPGVEQSQLNSYTWTLKINLSCVVSSGTVSTVGQWPGQPGFDGFSDATDLCPRGAVITYVLSGPHNPLPPNAEVAVITVTDDDCGEVHHYQISTDGAGSMLILDEF